MSRTTRNIPKSTLKRFDTPWQVDKFTQHKHMDSKRGSNKWWKGPGGMNCACCTKLPPEELKVKIRRYDRRKNNENTRNYKDE